MKPATQAMVLLVTAIAATTILLRQQKEISELKMAFADSLNRPQVESAPTANRETTSMEIEQLAQDAAQIHQLRAEVAELRRQLTAVQEAQKHSSNSSASGGHSSFQTTAQWLAAAPFGEDRDRLALAVMSRWAATNPSAAAAWSAQLPEGPSRDEAMSQVARRWALRDWNAASAWLESLPSGSSRDAAIDAFVTSADGYDIKLALEWANRMESPESRAARVEHTAGRWLREDPVAARAWLQSAQLPPGILERLLSAK